MRSPLLKRDDSELPGSGCEDLERFQPLHQRRPTSAGGIWRIPRASGQLMGATGAWPLQVEGALLGAPWTLPRVPW